MTEQASGSSLPQTRAIHQQHQDSEQQPKHPHIHFRNAETSQHRHGHHHHHHIRSQKEEDVPHKRQSSEDVVVVFKTVSVFQLTDSTGSTFIHTLSDTSTAGPPITQVESESTTVASNTEAIPTDETSTESSLESLYPVPSSSSSSSSSRNGASDELPLPTSSIANPTVTPPGSSMPFPTLTYAPITSSHLLTPTHVFPSLSSLLSNATSTQPIPSSIGNSTISLTTTSDGNFTFFGSTVESHEPTGTLTRGFPSSLTHSASTKTKSSSRTSTTYTVTPLHSDITPGNGGGVGSSTDGGAGGGPVVTAGSDLEDSSNSNPTPAGTIAGSVVGAISGLAFLLLLAAALLRWRKRRTGARLIQGPGTDRGYGAVATGGTGGPGGDGGMSDRRRSIPFAIPAALAHLTGQGRLSKGTVSSADGGERGFTKVSGRKLPPVLQFGGDGYTDPRASRASDQSVEYRASQLFFGEAPLSRLAVGAPMLQETGIPVFHDSPARSVVTNPGHSSNDPFSDDNRVDSPPPPRDPVGRSHHPHHESSRSHVSFSRFTEDL
ncbi:hypothetical protein GGS20DRAFT_585975 [Poronia punctata]|nr:hypothetical protein GGS20DRAFT_585975 [Poronia punctata]